MDYWLNGMQEKVSLKPPRMLEVGGVTNLPPTKERRKYVALSGDHIDDVPARTVGTLAASIFKPAPARKLLEFGTSKSVLETEVLSRIHTAMSADVETADRLAKYQYRSPSGDRYPALFTYIAGDLEKCKWQGFSGDWLWWQTDNVVSLVWLSFRNGLAAGTIYICEDCGKIVMRPQTAGGSTRGRKPIYCPECSSNENKRRRHNADPINVKWDTANRMMWSRVNIWDRWDEDQYARWKDFAKGYLVFVRNGTMTIDEWWQRFVTDYEPEP